MGQSNVNLKKITTSLIAVGLGVSVIIGAGTYKKSLSKEAPTFKASFEKGNETFKEFVYDINNQGFAKRLLQPGKISVSTGHGGGIVNKTDKAVLVNVRTEGLPGDPQLESVNQTFDKKSKKFLKPLEPGESLSLGVDLDIPRSLLSKKYNVSQGSIIFEDANSGGMLGVLPVKIINSAI